MTSFIGAGALAGMLMLPIPFPLQLQHQTWGFGQCLMKIICLREKAFILFSCPRFRVKLSYVCVSETYCTASRLRKTKEKPLSSEPDFPMEGPQGIVQTGTSIQSHLKSLVFRIDTWKTCSGCPFSNWQREPVPQRCKYSMMQGIPSWGLVTLKSSKLVPGSGDCWRLQNGEELEPVQCRWEQHRYLSKAGAFPPSLPHPHWRRMECAHQKHVLAEKLLSVNLNVLYLSVLVGLIWKGDVETANLSDILKRAISAWSSIKYFATCAKETVGSFSRRKLPLCRGKTHLAAKCRNGDRSSRGGSWVKSDLQSNMINKVIYFSYVCMQGFLWFCFKALFMFPTGVEGNLV